MLELASIEEILDFDLSVDSIALQEISKSQEMFFIDEIWIPACLDLWFYLHGLYPLLSGLGGSNRCSFLNGS